MIRFIGCFVFWSVEDGMDDVSEGAAANEDEGGGDVAASEWVEAVFNSTVDSALDAGKCSG